MNSDTIQIIENFVNSEEASEVVQDRFDWEKLLYLLIQKLPEPLSEDEEDRLHRDLRDWWKNGNFYPWAEGEVNNFGMTRWHIGDLDFWDSPEYTNIQDHFFAQEV